MSILRHPVTVPAALVGVLCLAVTAVVGLPILVSVVVGVAGGALFAAVVTRRAEGVLRRALGARPALVGEFPRLHNTVDGLCLTHGIRRPEVHVLDSAAGNALAMAGRDSASIVLTTGAADRLTLVELEALVAHLLVRCADEGLRGETTVVALGRFPSFGGAGLGRGAAAGGRDRMVRTDFEGAELTRFPPGMQEALRALAELGAAVDVPATTARLWLLQPDGRTGETTADHPSVDMRIAALGER
jgi:Zn-dependent protease with chaperone function